MKALDERRERFIAKAKEVHSGENLDYSRVIYVNNRTPVEIIDHDLKEDGTEYGSFWQTPSNHLKGQKHPLKKGKSISKKKRFTTEDFIKAAKEVHKGENLDYSKVVYKGAHEKVCIICHEKRPDGTEYGEFWQEANAHLKGSTHPDLGKLKQIQSQTLNTEEFVRKAKVVHCGDDYGYDAVDYLNNRTKVKIYCGKVGTNGNPHGYFEISPDNFLAGKGCPKCGNHLSLAEDAIVEYIQSLDKELVIEKRNHSVLGGNKELDIYIPSKGIAFEYDGLKWHSEEFGKDKWYHLKKTEACAEKGVCLFHIFEDEYLYHKKALFAKIQRVLGYGGDLVKVGARKCQVREIEGKTAKDFLYVHHIQGYCRSTLYLGGYYKDELVSVMSLTKEDDENWNLTRFATNCDYLVQGIFSKMFTWFAKKYYPLEVKTFLDRRWDRQEGENVYEKCGFIFDGYVAPDYRYTNGHGERMHKFGFRKKILHRKYGLPLDMTESQMVRELGYHKIWDCGLAKYVYKKSEI